MQFLVFRQKHLHSKVDIMQELEGVITMRVFASYSHQVQDSVNTLVQDLESLGHDVWFDQDIPGGDAWWSRVLAQIRECDLFVFALAPESLNSDACKLEYKYAFDLRKTILPILVTDGVSVNLLPSALSSIQFVDYRRQDRQAALALVNALGNLRATRSLPDPLPAPPEAPISHLGRLKDQVETTATLGFEEQTALLLQLKEHLNEDELNDVHYLLRQLLRRQDLLAIVAREIETILSNTEVASSDPQSTPTIAAPPSALQYADPQKGQGIKAEPPTTGTTVEPLGFGDKFHGRRTLTHNSHRIEISLERITYDGKEVAGNVSILKPRVFRVAEDGEEIEYEVKLGTRWTSLIDNHWVKVKRNGIIIYSD
jgi:hypothetical protein